VNHKSVSYCFMEKHERNWTHVNARGPRSFCPCLVHQPVWVLHRVTQEVCPQTSKGSEPFWKPSAKVINSSLSSLSQSNDASWSNFAVMFMAIQKLIKYNILETRVICWGVRIKHFSSVKFQPRCATASARFLLPSTWSAVPQPTGLHPATSSYLQLHAE